MTERRLAPHTVPAGAALLAVNKGNLPKNRRNARIQLPIGVWVAWQGDGLERTVSKVQDLSLGGVFIATAEPPPMGTVLKLLFSMPEGEVRITAVVRSVRPGEGMGVKFTDMTGKDRARLHDAVKRLRG